MSNEDIRSGQAGRILMLITTLTFGGAETQVVQLAMELNRRGWRVKVVCLIDPSAYVVQLADAGIETVSLCMPKGIPDPRAIGRLRSIVSEFKPDIVHCHMVHANLLGRISRLFCSMPALICTAHNLRECSEKGGPTWHKELLYRLTDFLADRTTIICTAAFNRYVQVRAVPAKKFELIPNGIDTRRFSPAPDARDSIRKDLGIGTEFAWLAVGRLVEQKNYSGLLHALTMLPENEWSLLVAGNGSLLPELQMECQRLNLGRRVKFLGASENIWRYYNAADGFVMSSRYEGLSVALLEAAAMGLPSVVTNVGGNAEVVIDGVTGYVVEPNDSRKLAEAMRTLQESPPEVRRSVGLSARQHCIKNFHFETITDKWVKLYNRYRLNYRISESRHGVQV